MTNCKYNSVEGHDTVDVPEASATQRSQLTESGVAFLAPRALKCRSLRSLLPRPIISDNLHLHTIMSWNLSYLCCREQAMFYIYIYIYIYIVFDKTS